MALVKREKPANKETSHLVEMVGSITPTHTLSLLLTCRVIYDRNLKVERPRETRYKAG